MVYEIIITKTLNKKIIKHYKHKIIIIKICYAFHDTITCDLNKLFKV